MAKQRARPKPPVGPAKAAPKPGAKVLPKRVSRTPAWLPAVATVGGVAVVVAAFLAIRWYTTPAPPPPLSSPAVVSVVTTITSLAPSELEAVAVGSATNRLKPVSGPALIGKTGKPEVFYLGAEYCPYCAAERWPMIIALSRFGTFSNLATTSSSSTDIYPNTPTFTFKDAVYTSQYVDFSSVETQDRNGNPLQAPTAEQQALVTAYDTANSIPFVDFGNRYAFAGATFVPDVMNGMGWQAIADALQQPDSAQAKAILGSSNLLTAAICKLTGDQPSSVCSGSSIQSIEAILGK